MPPAAVYKAIPPERRWAGLRNFVEKRVRRADDPWMSNAGGDPSVFDIEVKSDGQTGEKAGRELILTPRRQP